MEFINKIYLSYASLQYAINICQEKEMYRVGIAIKDDISNQEVKDFLLALVNDYDNIEKVINSKHEFKIYFKNGSLITIVDVSGNTRGRKYHLLIIDRNISKDIIECIVLPCWIPYYSKYCT